MIFDTTVERQLSVFKEQNEKLQQYCTLLQSSNDEILKAYEKTKAEHNEKYDGLSKKFSDALDDIRSKLDLQAMERLTLEKERETLQTQVEIYKQQLELISKQSQTEQKRVGLEKQLFESKLDELIETLKKKEKENSTLKKKVEAANHERNIMTKQLKTSQSKMDEFTKTVKETKNSFVLFQNKITQLEEENKSLREKMKNLLGMNHEPQAESNESKKKSKKKSEESQKSPVHEDATQSTPTTGSSTIPNEENSSITSTTSVQ